MTFIFSPRWLGHELAEKPPIENRCTSTGIMSSAGWRRGIIIVVI